MTKLKYAIEVGNWSRIYRKYETCRQIFPKCVDKINFSKMKAFFHDVKLEPPTVS